MNASGDRAIGMFDSGFGGLTVARAVIDLMPDEKLIYIGDTARYPYGPKPAKDVRGYAIELATSLVHDFDVKVIVVACNTAASVALEELQRSLAVPVIGVVAPGAKALLGHTRNRRVGVIGTTGTIDSGAYDAAIKSAASETGESIDLVTMACPGFVEFVERDETSGPAVTELAQRLLTPMREAEVDALLLGCTHYPYLRDVIGQVMGSGVRLVDGAVATAIAVRQMLSDRKLLRVASRDEAATRDFYSSGDAAHFAALGRRFLGPELTTAKVWPI